MVMQDLARGILEEFASHSPGLAWDELPVHRSSGAFRYQTEIDEDILRLLKDRGDTYLQMARYLDVSPGRIHRALKQSGIVRERHTFCSSGQRSNKVDGTGFWTGSNDIPPPDEELPVYLDLDITELNY